MPKILLVEPQFVLRRTIVAVARTMGLAELHEAASCAAALPLLAATAYSAVVLDTADIDAALRLLTRLRAGGAASAADTPVLALVATVADSASNAASDAASDTGSNPASDTTIGARLAPFSVDATLRKPFKVAEVLAWISEHQRRIG